MNSDTSIILRMIYTRQVTAALEVEEKLAKNGIPPDDVESYITPLCTANRELRMSIMTQEGNDFTGLPSWKSKARRETEDRDMSDMQGPSTIRPHGIPHTQGPSGSGTVSGSSGGGS